MTADEGDIVAAGQTLATIDTLTLNAELAAIAAQRSAAQANWMNLWRYLVSQQTIRELKHNWRNSKPVRETVEHV